MPLVAQLQETRLRFKQRLNEASGGHKPRIGGNPRRSRSKPHGAHLHSKGSVVQLRSSLEPHSGSVRFTSSGRSPARFCRVPVEVSVGNDLIPLLTKSWGLAPPSAVISIPPVRGFDVAASVFSDEKKVDLVFRRGLAEAARKTGAWVVTGALEDGVATLVGRALQNCEAPTIGICPYGVVFEKEKLVGGKKEVVQYSACTGLGKNSRSTSSRLDQMHTHFLLVDDGTADALGGDRKVREGFERYLSENDASGDGVQTPVVMLLINGDAHSLQLVVDALDPNDPISGGARPVVVMADSGGAAEDIFQYCNQEAKVLPTPGPARSEAYCELAKQLLPRVLEFGKMTGSNSTPQLAFFALSDDSSGIGQEQLDLALQKALLNDCDTRQKEVLLAVRWGEPLILQEQLEKGGSSPSSDPKGQGVERARLLSLALEAALLRRDVPVTRMLLEFEASPMYTRIQLLFDPCFNRYQLSEATWTLHDKDDAETEKEFVPDISMASQVLSEHVAGYAGHFVVRDRLAANGVAQALSPTWTDLMMWAILAGEPELAELLWSKTVQPLRCAVLASGMCRRLSRDPRLEPDSQALLEKSERFEQLALNLLDAIPDSKTALPLLMYIPCYAEADGSRNLMWQDSVLDLAANDDGMLNVPCMRVVAHRHSQHALSAVFSGNFPGSKLRINEDAGLMAVLCQSLLNVMCLPGAIVKSMPVQLAPNVDARLPRAAHAAAASQQRSRRADLLGLSEGSTSRKLSMASLLGGEEWEETTSHLLVSAAREMYQNAQRSEERGRTVDRRRFDQVRRAWRFLQVPKVKFAMYFWWHIFYIVFFVGALLGRGNWTATSSGMIWSNWMRNEGQLPRELSLSEMLLWAWTFTRFLGELKEVKTDFGIMRGLAEYIRDPWNKIDVTVSGLVFGTACVRTSCAYGGDEGSCTDLQHELSTSGYALAIIAVFIRTLQFLRYFEAIGVLIIVFFSMLDDVAVFLLFILIFSLGFGCAFALILPGETKNPVYFLFSSEPLWSPFWSLYGSDNLHVIEENIPYNNHLLRILAPTLLWVYMLIATIVLVNLLIAQMSRTYEDVMQDSKIRWQYARAEIILEFKDSKAPLPPPFNTCWMLFHDLPEVLRKAFGRHVTQSWPGFKLIRPTNGSGLTQALMQWCEQDSLRRCLAESAAKEGTSLESRVFAKVNESLAAYGEQEYTRFEATAGRLDRLETQMLRLERRTARVLQILDPTADVSVKQRVRKSTATSTVTSSNARASSPPFFDASVFRQWRQERGSKQGSKVLSRKEGTGSTPTRQRVKGSKKPSVASKSSVSRELQSPDDLQEQTVGDYERSTDSPR